MIPRAVVPVGKASSRPAARALLAAAGLLAAASLGLGCEHQVFRQTTVSDARMPDRWLEGVRCSDGPTIGEIRTEIVQPGVGEPVHAGQTVRVHYLATLSSGETVHDTQEGLPHELIVGSTRTICGFERALSGMLPGEQRRAYVPASLAFGETGRPPQIPPNSDLVFVIDLFLPGPGDASGGSSPRSSGGGGRRR